MDRCPDFPKAVREQFQIVCDADIVCQNAKIVVDYIRGLCYTISMKIREDISSFSAPRGRGAAYEVPEILGLGMSIRSCSQLCDLLSDSDHVYTVCHYSKRDLKLGAKGRYSVIRSDAYDSHIVYSCIAWFNDYSSCRDFLASMLKGVK